MKPTQSIAIFSSCDYQYGKVFQVYGRTIGCEPVHFSAIQAGRIRNRIWLRITAIEATGVASSLDILFVEWIAYAGGWCTKKNGYFGSCDDEME